MKSEDVNRYPYIVSVGISLGPSDSRFGVCVTVGRSAIFLSGTAEQVREFGREIIAAADGMGNANGDHQTAPPAPQEPTLTLPQVFALVSGVIASAVIAIVLLALQWQ